MNTDKAPAPRIIIAEPKPGPARLIWGIVLLLWVVIIFDTIGRFGILSFIVFVAGIALIVSYFRRKARWRKSLEEIRVAAGETEMPEPATTRPHEIIPPEEPLPGKKHISAAGVLIALVAVVATVAVIIVVGTFTRNAKQSDAVLKRAREEADRRNAEAITRQAESEQSEPDSDEQHVPDDPQTENELPEDHVVVEHVGSDDSDTYVYVTPTGECYHRKDCSSVSDGDRALTREEAIKKGFRPCTNCNP